jgi:hypothetical protein
MRSHFDLKDNNMGVYVIDANFEVVNVFQLLCKPLIPVLRLFYFKHLIVVCNFTF